MKSHGKVNGTERMRRLQAGVRHAALTRIPLLLSMGRAARSRSMTHLRLSQHQITLPRLPAHLDGLRLTHLSDLHVGELFTPSRLPELVQITNQLSGDLIAITGDLLDLTLEHLDQTIDAVKQMEAPLGVWLVMGNHDHLHDGSEVIRRCRAAGLSMLVNESVQVMHRGSRITIGGIDWAKRDHELARYVQSSFGETLAADDSLRLLLSHHPNAFDAAAAHYVDLTLSGHTHGGQVKLFDRRGRKGSIGLGSLTHRYPHGLYHRSGSYLHVTSGVGSWFPLRFQCPAELACLTLRSAAAAGL